MNQRVKPEATQPAPDVSSDRSTPGKDEELDVSPGTAKKAPLGITEIEELEDDAKGG